MKNTNRVWRKGMSAVLVSALVCGCAGIPVHAQEQQAAPALTGWALTEGIDWNLVKEPETVELSSKDQEQLSKEETVYVIAGADGVPQKLIVSDWLKNAAGMNAVKDATELTGISTVKGEGHFQKEDGNLGVWDADGNDIYYQGSIEKALPVDMKITYQLEGKTVSPEELAGQSGKVTIRFDYDNKQKEKVPVGEKEEELYVPFVILTSLVLDNDHFRNIQVTNGKIINDGERTLVMGYAMPGLKDNLDTGSEDLDLDELDLADYVELTADATDFELATTLTVATNEIFGDMDIDLQDKMNDLSDDMEELEDAMEKLMDGTSDLYDGVLQLHDGSEELDDGVQELKDGAQELYEGTGSLKSGAGDLAGGVNTLVAGLEELTAQNGKLTAAAKGLFEGALAQANQSASVRQILGALQQAGMIQEARLTVSNYGQFSKMLQPLIQQMQQGISLADLEEDEIPEEQAENMETSKEQETGEMPGEDLGADGNRETDGDNEEKDTSGEADDTENAGNEDSGEDAGEEDAGTDEMKGEDTGDGEEENQEKEAKVQERENPLVQASPQEQLMQMIMNLMAGDPTLKPLIVNVETHYQLYQGILQYTAGTAKAYDGSKALLDGAKKLSSGASELQGGAGKLKDGVAELKDGTAELKDGVVELRDGSLELKDGTVEFNDEGIQKLADMLNGDLQDLNDRFEATKEAARAYKSFAGISDEMQGKVKFIYKTAAIEK